MWVRLLPPQLVKSSFLRSCSSIGLEHTLDKREVNGSIPFNSIWGIRQAGLSRHTLNVKIMGSNPICPVWNRSSEGSEHESSKLIVAGSSPAGFVLIFNFSECSSTWLEHTAWDRKARGSNPLTPIKFLSL